MSEKKQPAVSVGIMGDKRIEFTLCTDYKCSNGSIVSGNAVVELVDGEILYNGKKYESSSSRPACPRALSGSVALPLE